MRRSLPLPSRRAALNVAMTPMIDVVFLLNVFFLVAASFQQREADLAASVVVEAEPGAGASVLAPPAIDIDEVLVAGVRNGERVVWTVGERQAASRQELTAILREVATIARDLPVTIEAGPDVPLGAVVAAYDAARAAGFDNVRLAASRASIEGAAAKPPAGGSP
ncbi:MAG: ExbD/TolR family protein [Lacipirellulaceae bacterium]